MKLLVSLLAVALAACATTPHVEGLMAMRSPRCDDLDVGRRTWGAAAAASAAAASVGGIVAVASPEGEPRIVTVISSAVVAGFAALSAWLADDYADGYRTARCMEAE